MDKKGVDRIRFVGKNKYYIEMTEQEKEFDTALRKAYIDTCKRCGTIPDEVEYQYIKLGVLEKMMEAKGVPSEEIKNAVQI